MDFRAKISIYPNHRPDFYMFALDSQLAFQKSPLEDDILRVHF